MGDGIDIIYRGYQLVAGMRNGRPVAYIHHGHTQLARFVGPSIIDCANRAKLRIDQMAGGFPAAQSINANHSRHTGLTVR